MGTDEAKLAWDKGEGISFTVRDCTISGSALDSLKEGEICYESATGETCIGTATGYKPIKISYEGYPIGSTIKTISKEQEQIETLIRAVTNLIKEVEELKKDNKCLEAENEGLRNEVNNLLKTSSVLEEQCNKRAEDIVFLIDEKKRLDAEIQALKETKEDKKPVYEFTF